MNTDELQNKLRELEPRRPSTGFAERILAQRPAIEPAESLPWWRRRIAIPVPLMAAILLLFVGIQIAQWSLRAPVSNQPNPVKAVPAANKNDSDRPAFAVAMNGNCSFRLDH